MVKKNSVFNRTEKILGEGENAGKIYSHFLLFSQCGQKLSTVYFRVIETWQCRVRVKIKNGN